MLRKTLLILVFIHIFFYAFTQSLTFNSYYSPVNQRTSLRLFTENQKLIIQDKLIIEFDFRINTFDLPGCIFQLLDLQNDRIYSLHYASLHENESQFRFNIEGVRNLCTYQFENDSLSGGWIPVTICFDLSKQSISTTILDKSIVVSNSINDQSLNSSVIFGCYNHILDVPDFSLRRLQITADEKKIEFPLNDNDKHIHDVKGKKRGFVKNPKWDIEKSYKWESIYNKTISSLGGIRFDENKQTFHIFTEDSLISYNLTKSIENCFAYETKINTKMNLASGFVDLDKNNLSIYEVNGVPDGLPTIYTLDLISKKWNKFGYASLPTQLHHHNGFINPYSNRLTLFGGFGNNKYSNNFYEYDFDTDRWNTIQFTGDTIEPRYFAGSVINPNKPGTLYIYGGMGNKYGDHTIGRSYFNDLYEVDLIDQKIKKRWASHNNLKKVSGSEMVLSKNEKYIYTLMYPEYMISSYLQLYKINIMNGKHEILGDSIPICSDKIETNARLYFNKKRSEFYCAIFEINNGQNNIRILRLNSPAISWSQFNQNQTKKPNLILYSFIILIIISFVLTIIKYRNIRYNYYSKNKKKITIAKDDEVKEIDVDLNKSKLSVNTINIFGPFQVLDANGTDLAYLFSPRLKQIFIYLILNSRSNGVLSASLSELFWSEKTNDKARNIKGVTINQIRKIITTIDGLNLIYEKGYYKLIFEGCYCDYWHFIDLQNNEIMSHEIEKIFLRGKFLDGLDSIVLDNYKANVEEFMNKYLTKSIQENYEKLKIKMVLRLCRILSSMDPINETALMYSIFSLNRLNCEQESITIYSSFLSTYKNIMNEDYKYSYKTICEHESKMIQELSFSESYLLSK